MNKAILLIISLLFIFGCKKTETLPPPPTPDLKLPKLITNSVTNLTYFSCTFNGKITDSVGENISEFGFIVDSVSMPTTDKNLNKFLGTKLNKDGTFSIDIHYLQSDMLNYVRAYAITKNGIGYGNEIKFTSLSQKTYNGSIYLTSQQEVIEFGAHHYNTINGTIFIEGTDITDLSPLHDLAVVNFGLRINSTSVEDFTGLENLEIVGAEWPTGFSVQGNDKLKSFKGLSKLQLTRGDVQIDHNRELMSLDGLDSYIAVSAGMLRIGECEKLQNINGLKNLTFVGDNLYLINDPSLNDISGFSNLSELNGRLYITNNASLPNLNGLEKLTAIPSGIEIDNNQALYDINGLKNVTTINGAGGVSLLLIKNNPLLTNLDAFSNVEAADAVHLINNVSLKNVEGLKKVKKINDILHIENNPKLTGLKGFDNVTYIRKLEILTNESIVSLTGLNAVKKINDGLTITGNQNLTSLTGLENLTDVEDMVYITGNISLNDFCPIKKLLSSFSKDFISLGNSVNPSKEDIIANCQ